VHCASLLRELTGAEDALVVNNCAAALVLALNTVADGRDALLSRGELVEIGGSFRVHEIMAKSGARLREVGATNRTHLADYERALGPDTGVLLKVHRSNFAVHGFTAEAAVRDLAPLAAKHALPILHDLGSGLLVSLESIGLRGEPTAREALDAGATIVVMSGDKLLGGPQAGLIVGDARWLDAMRRNPLARSYRVDKLTLAALEATLALYRDPARALTEIPTLALLGATPGALRERADALRLALGREGIESDTVQSMGSVGAGAFPDAALPGAAVALAGDAERWASRLRGGEIAVIGRVHDGRMHLDLRAVLPDEVADLARAAVAARG
jgi:L-seryl-tRNA(Ser) seleniumtransferase